MARVQANITKFYQKLETFRNAERYTDVTVECMDGSFNCHRLALAATCDYFDAMFGGKFRESYAENVSLPSINAATFEQVLKFVYTGNAVVNSSNVCSLLEASEFFKLPGIEDLCVEYIQQNEMISIQNTLKMFAFARSTRKEMLSTILGGYIADNFNVFSKIDSFLDLSFADLKFIFDRQSPLLLQNAESLVGTIARWIRRNQEERFQYLDKLLRIIRFENMSTEFIQYAFGKFIADPDSTLLTQLEKPIGYSENSELQKTAHFEAGTSLRVFVGHEDKVGKLMKIFSINRARHCSISSDIFPRDRLEYIQSVSHDSHLYCLNSLCSGAETFSAYTSISMHPELSLSVPPIIFGPLFLLCALQNNLYVYKTCIFKKAIRTCPTPLTTFFDDEEISRGVFVYNSEVDHWFPVPLMKRQLEHSCFAAYEGSLFLIGGMNSDRSCPAGYSQALDCRIGKWQELPKTHNPFVGAACCIVKGKIYICGGSISGAKQTERYDPVAGKWEKIAPMNKGMCFHRAVNYLDQLWAIKHFQIFDDRPNRPKLKLSNDFYVEFYDPNLNTWSSFSALKEVAEEATFSGNILGAVVF